MTTLPTHGLTTRPWLVCSIWRALGRPPPMRTWSETSEQIRPRATRTEGPAAGPAAESAATGTPWPGSPASWVSTGGTVWPAVEEHGTALVDDTAQTGAGLARRHRGRRVGPVPRARGPRCPVGVGSAGYGGTVSMEVYPATSDRFDDVAVVLGPKNPTSSVCWCLSHRLDSKLNGSLVGPARGEYVRRLCARPVAPGVLAYDGAGVVGWAAVAPRSELPFARSRKIPHIDDLPVWTIWCIRIRPGRRGRGIAHVLLDGAVAYAQSQGAPAVEGYPVDNRGEKVDLTMAYVGTRKLFEDAGFTLATETDSVSGGFPRVLMRRDLR
jgi:GNAT superfamily N-acetyltransferase